MAAEQSKPKGPDLAQGIPLADVPEGGMVGGHVGDDAVLLARRGNQFFAIGATCSHYGGPLAEGLAVGGAVRCPWHHACFSLQTGEAIGAPAFHPVPCWDVEKRDGKAFVRAKIKRPDQRKPARARSRSAKSERVVIVGGGAAGFAAAEMLRRNQFPGSVTLLSADEDAPYDRPNCSKDYLAGNAPEDWMPLRPPEFYQEQSIELQLNAEVTAIDAKARCRSTSFFSRPAQNRYVSISPAPINRTFICCARSAIRGASLPRRTRLGALSCSVRASSASKSPRP
jgi:nitrite reductase/ring-hydroxylating ferredoxin subunit